MSITKFYRLVLSGLPLFLLLLPLIVIPGMYNPYEFPKFIFLLIGIQIFITIRALFCLKKRIPLLHFDLLSYLVILFLFLLAISNSIGLDPHISFLGGMYRHQGFLLWGSLGLLFLLFYSLSTNEKKNIFEQFSKYSFFFLFFLCNYSILQGILFFVFHDYSIPTSNGRILAMFGNPNFLAGYVVMLLPISLFGMTVFKKMTPRKKIFFQTLLILLVVITILLTDSKSALLSLGIILLEVLFISKHLSFSRKRESRFRIPPRGLSISWWSKSGITIAILLIITIATITNPLRLSPWDNRSIIWSYGIQSVIQHPTFGIGQENYELIVDKARHIPIDNAHNIFLELAVAGGIPALLLFCALFIFTFRNSIYPVKLSLLAFLICACFNPLSIAQLATYWFLISLSLKEETTIDFSFKNTHS